ncbi:MAG TPA: hypothetical protein VEC38_00205 [Candidatus Binataceae bacterium]|nr:hypothetical protein [Candidatus Binataceae bacterium]
MTSSRFRFIALAAATAALLALSTTARAQFRRKMPVPVTTTIVITKPGPGEIYGNKQVVTIGVSGKTYKFVLEDGWVDDPRQLVRWPDVWQLVRIHQPNFMVTGIGEEKFSKIQPGQTFTMRGVFTPLGRNFEVMGIEEGKGTFAPPKAY